jgi:hypothetical protein
MRTAREHQAALRREVDVLVGGTGGAGRSAEGGVTLTGTRSKERASPDTLDGMNSRVFFRAGRSGLVMGISAGVLLAAAPSPSTPLPELNEKVLAFARAKLGTSVGDGSCTSLAIAALKEAGARFYPGAERTGALVWGEAISSFKEALPGDILQFEGAVFQGKKFLSKRRWITWHHEYPHHTAIVSRVSEGGKVVAVLHQNVAMQGKDAKETENVQETSLPIDSLQPGGSIRIFRPSAAPAPRRKTEPGTDNP